MIVFVHLLNDTSGSPRVLLNTMTVLKSLGWSGRLFVGSDGNGLLSDSGLPTKRFWYKRTKFRLLTLFTYLLSQLCLFLRLLGDRTIERNAVVYVNTLLPFGAALYGRLTGRKVVYHIHESSIQPALLKSLLVYFARKTSSLNIYVSDTHMRALPIDGVPASRVYNALDTDFSRRASDSRYLHRHDGIFYVLMVASLRDYKGIPEYLRLAKNLEGSRDIRFELLLNETAETIDEYFLAHSKPENLTVYPAAKDTTPFFRRAGVLLNLSRADTCVETFGMTILEALSFGVPVIVPPVGGPAELVTDGIEGYQVDSRDEEMLSRTVSRLAGNEDECFRLSRAGRERAMSFSPSQSGAALHRLLCATSDVPGSGYPTRPDSI